jgi:hypothetical protein
VCRKRVETKSLPIVPVSIIQIAESPLSRIRIVQAELRGGIIMVALFEVLVNAQLTEGVSCASSESVDVLVISLSHSLGW